MWIVWSLAVENMLTVIHNKDIKVTTQIIQILQIHAPWRKPLNGSIIGTHTRNKTLF